MKRFGLLCVFAIVFASVAFCGDVVEVPFVEGQTPPDAEPGYVWCLVTKPAIMKTITEKVKVKDATFYVEKLAPQYDWKEETIEVVPAHKRAVVDDVSFSKDRAIDEVVEYEYKFIPAKYEEVEKEVVVVPAYDRLVVREPVFDLTTEEYMVEPARSEVKPFNCEDSKVISADEAKGECYAKVSQPAKMESLCRKILVENGTVVKESVPAVTKKVKVRQVVEEARIEKIEVKKNISIAREIPSRQKVEYVDVPAQVVMIRKMVEVVPAGERRVEIDAEYAPITRQVMEQPSTIVWRKIKSSDCNNREKVDKLMKKYKSIPGIVTGVDY